ncbi:MAG: serine acetyltransferase, partial [Thermotogota bacterium]|nr:serine acetyltransferase [Thermotogota bacterium]
GIVVNGNVSIGKNCNISPGVTLGQTNRGKNKGCPTIGDNVFIASGAKIIGNILVGNNVAIGANCVVIEDVPENSVIVGVPGKIISRNGSVGYINKTDY